MHVFSIPFSIRSLTASDGWPLSLLHWKGGQGRRLLLILPGRAEPAAKYARPAAELMERGYDVWTVDWRGQGLSGWAHGPLAARRGHVKSFDRLTDDLAEVLSYLKAERGGQKPLIVAHSMGGALLLRSWQRLPSLAGQMAAALMTGPMIDIPTAPFPRAMARFLSRLAVGLGHGERYALGQRDWQACSDFAQARHRTSSEDAFEDEQLLLQEFPELQVGGATWGWVDSAFRLCRQLWSARAAWPSLPVRVLVGEHDHYVPFDRHQTFFRRFPDAHVSRIAGGAHELMHEVPTVQNVVWQTVDDLRRAVDASGPHADPSVT